MSSALASPAVRAEEPELDLYAVFGVLRRRFTLFTAILALGIGTTLGLSLRLPPIYRASATVTPDKTPPIFLEGTDVSDLFTQSAGEVPDVFTIAELARSENVREGAMARLAPVLGVVGARAALRALDVQRIRDTEFVRISVEHASPNVAASAVNAVAESLVDMSMRARRRRATGLKHFLQQQSAEAEQRLQTSEDELVAFKNQYGDVALAEETKLNLEKLAQLEARRVELALAREEGESLTATLRSQLATLEIELAGLERQFTSRHPAIISTRARIAETRRRLESAEERNRSMGRQRQQLIHRAIREQEAGLRAIPAREAALANLTRRVRGAEEVYLLLATRLQQVIIAEASIGSAIQIVDRAKTPLGPARSRARKVVFFGAALALLFGLAAVFALEQIDDRVMVAEDTELLTGAPLLAAIPEHPAKRGRRASPWPHGPFEGSASSLAGSPYRALGFRLLAGWRQAGGRALFVTSAVPGEGKTTVARSLAAILASTGRRVCLIDCNLGRPAPAPPSGEEAPGLSEVLRGEKAPEDVLPARDEPRLWVVHRGIRSDVTDVLNADRLAQFLNVARMRADLVLLDGPSLLTAPEAEVLGACADGTLLVVRMRQTSRRSVIQAARRLGAVGCSVIGTILTFAPVRSARGA